MKRLFGLIGYPLGHSFSKRYFTEKFERESVSDANYELFPIESVDLLPHLIQEHPELRGLNVTIPHKQAVIPYLDELDETAAAIGAVNCIRIATDGQKKGFNTDAIGFELSLQQVGNGRWAQPQTRAAVLGNGGAAKAVCYVLDKLGIPFQVFTRGGANNEGSSWPLLAHFSSLPAWMQQHTKKDTLLINTTPLGMAPATNTCPEVPFHLLNNNYLVFDLVYNPVQTLLLQRAAEHGASIENGLPMLHGQAEAAWAIWNN
jgi:shikimate dehydrogenase